MQKINKISLSIFGLLGLFKIFSIIPFNRMAADDYSSALMLRLGFWNDFVATYTTSLGRFSTILTETLFMLVFKFDTQIIAYSLITFDLLLFAFYILFKRVFNLDWKNIYIYILASVFVSSLYILTPNKSESWYWLTGSVVYLWPITLFTIGLSYLFVKKLRFVDYFFAFITSFFAVSYNESLGMLAVATYGLIFILDSYKKKSSKMHIMLFVSSIVSFLVMFFSPANAARRAGPGGEPMSLVGSLLYSLKEGPLAFLNMFVSYAYVIIPLFIVLIFVFSFLMPHKEKDGNVWENNLEKIFYTILIALGFSVLYMLPGFNSLGRTPPDRSYITLSFMLLSCMTIISYLVSRIVNSFRTNTNIIKFIYFVGGVALVISGVVFTNTLAADFYIARNYSLSFDNMINDFKMRSKNGDMSDIVVRLPEHGLVAEVIDKPGAHSYKNQSLSDYFGIGKVITKNEEQN